MSRVATTLAIAATIARLVSGSPVPQGWAPWQSADWQSAPWQTASWQSAPWQTAPGQTVPGGPGAAPVATQEAVSTPAAAAAPAPTSWSAAPVAQNNAEVVVTDVVTNIVVVTVTADAPAAPASAAPENAPAPAQYTTNAWAPPVVPTSNAWAPPAAPPASTLSTVYVSPVPVPTSTSSTSEYTPPPAPPSSTWTPAPAPPSSVYTPPAAPSSSAAPAPAPSSGTSSGDGTVYNGIATVNPNPTNALGSCGGSTGDATFTVALSTAWMKSWNSPLCNGQIRLTNTGPSTDDSIGGKGNSVTVTIMDTCEGCDETHLDLSTAAWNQLTNSADPSQVSISWEFI